MDRNCHFIRAAARKFCYGLVVLLAIRLGCPPAAEAAAAADSCLATAWPHEKSALQPDPELRFGRLDNGFRYVLKVNREPRGRVVMMLDVEAGSLYEEKEERGLAHFLEHMLFNGTTNFPPGSLIDYFQSIGMNFGGDVNGYTTYTDTVYKLILPDNTSAHLDRGLLVLRDYADGALLLEEEIDRERGVILAEKTARDSADYRSGKARTAFIFRDMPLADRQPIGDESVLEQAGRDELLSFYRKWYRPDNMILVVVGDFDPDQAEPLIVSHFASLQAGDRGACPEYGVLAHRGVEVFYHHEPELGATEVLVETMVGKLPETDSMEVRADQLRAQMAAMIINRRLGRLLESPDTPFDSAGYYDTVMFDRFRLAGIRAVGKKERWREALALIDEVVGQVLSHGFAEAELERVKEELRGELEDAVLAAPTRNSMQVAHAIVATLGAGRVPQSAAQELAALGPLVESTSLEDLQRSVRESWREPVRLVQVVGDAALAEPTGTDELRAYYLALNERLYAPSPIPEHRPFPYLSVTGQATAPVKVTRRDDLGLVRQDFDYGLVLNLKVTDFAKNQIGVALHFGNGLRSLPRRGLDLLATAVVNGSGTGTLQKSQLREALSGSSVDYRFHIGEESFTLQGSAVTGDIEQLFQVVHALLNDPGFRESEYQIARKQFDAMYRRLEQSVEGGARLHLDRFFGGEARAAGLPDRQQFMALELSEVKAWLRPYFAGAPLELSVVGDFDPAVVADLASRYFAPPPARDFSPGFEAKADFPVGRRLQVTVPSQVDKTLIRYGWHTDDDSDIGRTRRLHVLAGVIEERLRRRIREELALSYSPSAYSATSSIYPGFGAIFAEVVVDHGAAAEAMAALDDLERSLGTEEVGDEELDRVLQPLLTSLKDSGRSNAYWLHTVLALSSRRPERLNWPLTMIDDFRSITAEEIRTLADRYIRQQRRATGIVRSDGGSIDQGPDRAGVFPDDDG